MQKFGLSSFSILFTLLFSTLCSKVTETADHLENITYKAAIQGYEKDFIGLVEMIYGKGFLSQGGKQSVEKMIGNIDLSNARVLDIGSGIGGPDIYIAKHHSAHVVGLEPQKWMIDQAKINLAKEKKPLRGTVDFIVMQSVSNLKQFPDDSFDIVFSKEALLHIPKEVKRGFFAEIYRVLKPGGSIILMDWMCTDIDYSENTRKMMELDGVAYNLISHEAYLQNLQDVGFTEITLEDITTETYKLSKQNVATILSLESKIKEKYDEEVFHESLNSWQWQSEAFQAKELMTGVFRAKKD